MASTKGIVGLRRHDEEDGPKTNVRLEELRIAYFGVIERAPVLQSLRYLDADLSSGHRCERDGR